MGPDVLSLLFISTDPETQNLHCLMLHINSCNQGTHRRTETFPRTSLLNVLIKSNLNQNVWGWRRQGQGITRRRKTKLPSFIHLPCLPRDTTFTFTDFHFYFHLLTCLEIPLTIPKPFSLSQ